MSPEEQERRKIEQTRVNDPVTILAASMLAARDGYCYDHPGWPHPNHRDPDKLRRKLTAADVERACTLEHHRGLARITVARVVEYARYARLSFAETIALLGETVDSP